MIRIETAADEPVYYQFEFWQSAPLKHGVFTRLGGVSQAPWDSLNVGGNIGDDVEAVAQNHERIYAALELDGSRACTVWQVHGAETVVANGPLPDRKWLAKADGIVTDKIGLPLAMRFADCVPILFYDPVRHVIGMAHAGWRGTVQGAALSTLVAMRDTYGSQPADVLAAIGPSIGPENYQVGPEVVEAVQAYFGSTDGLIHWTDDGSAYFNLWEANRLTLARAGVEQIEVAGICTASHTHEFYSHRAEKGQTGRFGAVMALQPLTEN
ncbi:MAG: peptidoglycan editing factor PgeF [Chloroflexi bacterium]|nr:peptidoglycan editing factor PgeF [Chloroflexota bacterium]